MRELEADPSRARPAEEVFAELRREYQEIIKPAE